jgi:ABC-2 type transport system permease protein
MSRAEAVSPEAGAGAEAVAGAGAVGGGPFGAAGRPSPLRTLGLFRSELVVTFRRWRTLALYGILVVIPLVMGIAVKIQTRHGAADSGDGGPPFVSQVTNNALFLVLAALGATLPIFLPMAIGVVAGDAVAGEANAGTLRYLLVAPAGRTRLLLAKAFATVTFCATGVLLVAVTGLAAGAAMFPLGDVTLLSGTTVSFADGLLRALAVAGVVVVSLLGIAAVGLFISTLTNSGIAAMASTVGLLITVQILDTIPQLHAIHPYLFPHYWLSFADLVRDPIIWDQILKNFTLQAAYVAVFGSAAWARFTTRDITA